MTEKNHANEAVWALALLCLFGGVLYVFLAAKSPASTVHSARPVSVTVASKAVEKPVAVQPVIAAFIKIEHADVSDDGVGRYTCHCNGRTNLPDGVIIQIVWRYARPQPAVTIVEGGATVAQGRFAANLGNFPKSRQAFPGSYQVTAFFSPAAQKQLVAATFGEDTRTFELGERAAGAAMLTGEQEWLAHFLQEVMDYYGKMSGVYQTSQQDPEAWYRGRSSRQAWISNLRQGETKHGYLYLCHPFARTAYQMRPLVNLLEMLEEAGETALQEKDDTLWRKRTNEMCELYPQVWNDFRHESVALSPHPIGELLKQIKGWRQQLRMAPVPKNKVELSAQAVRIYRLEQELAQFPRTLPAAFASASNDWLWQLRQTVAESAPEKSELSPWPRCDVWAVLVDSLLAEWERHAALAGVMTAPTLPEARPFAEVWREMLSQDRLPQQLKAEIRRELERFQEHLQIWLKQLNTTGSSEEEQDSVTDHQQDIRLLAQMVPDSQRLFADYLRVSGRMVHVQDMLSVYRQGEIGRAAVDTEMALLQQEIKALQAACQE